MTSGVLSAVLLEYTYKLYYTVVVGGRQGPIHYTQLPVSIYVYVPHTHTASQLQTDSSTLSTTSPHNVRKP